MPHAPSAAPRRRAPPRPPLLLLLLAAAAVAATAPARAAAQPPSVTASLGKILGAQCPGNPAAVKFTGIPYAAPPTGPRRWAPPEAYTAAYPRAGLQAARVPPRCAPQPGGQEDCLYLNVYKPAAAGPASKLPVRVFIHGGSLEDGAASDYDGCPVAADADVVLVNLNYRLGPFGYLALPGLAAKGGQWAGTNGNWGTLDQRLALEWVQKEIGAFGGDPAKVLLYGESAGCWSVISQMLAPNASGLFASAACESQGIDALCGEPMADTVKKSLQYTNALRCDAARDPAACMRRQSAAKITRAWNDISDGENQNNLAATIDGVVLPDWPAKLLQRGAVARVPFVAGFNTNEGASLVDTSWYKDLLSGVTSDITKAQYGEFFTAAMLNVPAALRPEILQQYAPSNPEFKGSYFAAATALISDSTIVCPSLRTMRMMAAAGLPVYGYEYSQPQSDGCAAVYAFINVGLKPDKSTLSNEKAIARSLRLFNGSHGAELEQVFMAAYTLPSVYGVPCSSQEQQMSSWVSGLWNALAKTGAPAGPISKSLSAPHLKAAPAWPRFSSSPAAPPLLYSLNYYAPGAAERPDVAKRCEVFDRLFDFYQASGSYYL